VTDPSGCFQEKAKKTHTLIPENDALSQRLGFSNNQLKAVNRLKNSFRLSKPWFPKA